MEYYKSTLLDEPSLIESGVFSCKLHLAAIHLFVILAMVGIVFAVSVVVVDVLNHRVPRLPEKITLERRRVSGVIYFFLIQ